MKFKQENIGPLPCESSASAAKTAKQLCGPSSYWCRAALLAGDLLAAIATDPREPAEPASRCHTRPLIAREKLKTDWQLPAQLSAGSALNTPVVRQLALGSN